MVVKVAIPKQIMRVFIIALILEAALLGFAVVNFKVSNNLMIDFLKNEGVSTAFSLEAAVRNAGIGEPGEISPVLEKYRDREYIAYMTVLNRDNVIVADLDGEKTGRKVTGKFIEKVKETQQVMITQKTSGDAAVYEIIVPVHLGQLDRFKPEGGRELLDPQEVTRAREGKYHILLLGIYAAHGREMVRPALFQLVLVIVMVTILGILGVYQYRTIRKYLELEDLNKRNERLAAIGTVAAGVAHEIKNPLGAIKGFSQLLAEGKSDPEEESEYIRLILKESERLEFFLGQLLDFTRNRKYEFRDTNIGLLVDETAELVTEQARNSGVDLEIISEQSEVLARVDSEAIKQVLLNLFINSIQAMPHGGTLSISFFERQGKAAIDVRDTGTGLQPGTEEEIFQPFFTTKNKGIGLGLALSKQIIEDHGGVIKAGNAPGGGAAFIITLPGK